MGFEFKSTGDFSFARSLVTHHRCRNVLATSYDSKEVLYSKYPQVEKNIQDILGAFSTGTERDDNNRDGQEGGDAGTGTVVKEQEGEKEEEGEGEVINNTSPTKEKNHHKRRGPKIIFSVDARKLGLAAGGGKEVRVGFTRRGPARRPTWQSSGGKRQSDQSSTEGPWDLICFNFPHVGGLSTDVNRQVRANQELLVAFFKACVPLLSSAPAPDEEEEDQDWPSSGYSDSEFSQDGDTWDLDTTGGLGKRQIRTEPGQILVTLFEGEPYTLWNIRDLARHAGLRVVTSFKFPWTSYPGYSHARTLGEVESRHGGRGGWRGEDREARMYVFEARKETRPDAGGGDIRSSKTVINTGKKKRSREVSDSDVSD